MFYSLAQQKRKPVKSWERPGLSGRPCKRNLTHVSLSPVTQRSTQCHAALNTVFQMSAFLAVTKGSCPSTSDPSNPCSSHCVGGKVPEKLCKHASTSGPWLDSPQIPPLPVASHHPQLSAQVCSERPSPVT